MRGSLRGRGRVVNGWRARREVGPNAVLQFYGRSIGKLPGREIWWSPTPSPTPTFRRYRVAGGGGSPLVGRGTKTGRNDSHSGEGVVRRNMGGPGTDRACRGRKVFRIANEKRLRPGVVVVHWFHGSEWNDSPGHRGPCQPDGLNPRREVRGGLCQTLAVLGRRGPPCEGYSQPRILSQT